VKIDERTLRSGTVMAGLGPAIHDLKRDAV